MVLNGSYSNYSTVESGVPQGSVLGPLLFLIYINDLERNITSNIKFFADDTILFSVINDPLISANDLNHDLKSIQQWAHQWMEFNPDPTKQAKEVLFSCKKSSVSHMQLTFNGMDVEKVNNQKHLGFILDSHLSFGKLNEKIINVGILKHLFFFKDFLFLKMTCAQRGRGIHPPPGTLRNNYNIYYTEKVNKDAQPYKTNKQSKVKKQTYGKGGMRGII